jgi:hypothetical protein
MTPEEIALITDQEKDILWEEWYIGYAIDDANAMWEYMDDAERIDWLMGSGAASTCFYDWLRKLGEIPEDME